jgi:hypothetical protein
MIQIGANFALLGMDIPMLDPYITPAEDTDGQTPV